MTTDRMNGLSVSYGAQADIRTQPLYDYFASACESHGDQVWLSEGERSVTFNEAENIIQTLSDGLAGLGIHKGDRVGLCMPNALAYPLFTFACWRQGIIVVGMTALYAEPMLRTLIEESTPKLVVTMNTADIATKAMAASNGLCDVLVLSPTGEDILSDDERGGVGAPDGSMRYKEFLAQRIGAERPIINTADDLALLQFTGGTTGKPKGTMLSHHNVSACFSGFIHQMPKFERGGERFIASGPFSHILGTTTIMGACTALASEIVIPNRFDPEETTQLILDKKITMVAAVPTMFQAMARSSAATKSDWPDLRYAICGGSPLPPEIADEFYEASGIKLLQAYGLSETSAGISFTSPSVETPDFSVGFPMPNCRIEVRDPEDGLTVLPFGEVGEICVDGPQLMQGYWKRDEATEEAMKHGVFHTGDSGYLNEDGALFIVDRIKDIIIASGFNVYPSQVENAIYEHAAIAEAAVVGAKDDYRGETVKAVVALKSGKDLTLEELQSFLKDKLSPIEMPRILDILAALPKTTVGKIDKTKLR